MKSKAAKKSQSRRVAVAAGEVHGVIAKLKRINLPAGVLRELDAAKGAMWRAMVAQDRHERPEMYQ